MKMHNHPFRSDAQNARLNGNVRAHGEVSKGQVYHHSTRGTVRYLLPVITLTRFFGWRTIRPTVVKLTSNSLAIC